MASESVKVLVAGSANSCFLDLFKKVKTLNDKHGPFDALLCTGNFFAKETTEASLDDLMNEKIDVPITTYFITGNEPLPPAIAARIASTDGEVCSNLYHLGKKGSMKTASGLKIAFLSGSYDATHYSETDSKNDTFYRQSDIKSLQSIPMPASSPAGVDILLTMEWPEGIQVGSATTPSSDLNSAARPISELAAALKPRYHFAASEKAFYEREPYRNATGVVSIQNERKADHVTRFIGLGEVSNTTRQRWFYAFNLVPLSKIQPEKLQEEPQNTTNNPFLEALNNNAEAAGQKRPLDESNASYFWGGDQKRPHDERGSRPPPEGYVCKICRQPGHFISECPMKGQREMKSAAGPDKGCWFCLSNPKVEKHLIVSIGSEIYATLAKGPLVASGTPSNGVPGGGHILLVAINHYPTFRKVPMESQSELEAELANYKSAVKTLFEKHGQAMVVFEVSRESARGVSHAHVQIVPVPVDKVKRVEEVAMQEAERQSLQWIDTAPEDPGLSYFKMDLPNNKSMVHIIKPRENFNLQLGRSIIAQALDQPDRENWKVCAQTMEEEHQDAEALKAAFKPYDFTLE